ncbi:hypothetical protein IC229_22210 [Spirosoma sp. BT702]|uniref:Uncharacterized protein n=1 Tax=Spirosoma profusum TaxID=2771354 RepID=A0A926XYT1_9BACT|nr:hypothetical protein [Spirosoma profusum]MBD2703374.1 hypothetical protein [Spirosoma profusum]
MKNKTMFSQYSWWDFAKVVGVTLVVYYIYVLWTYYREDIREWISNRGSQPPQPAPIEEEEDSSALYSVKSYAGVPSEQTPQPIPDDNNHTDLTGLIANQEQAFTIPLTGEVQRPAEQSLTQLLSAGQRIQTNQQGVLVANDPTDKDAERLATVINQQQEHRQAFKDISFTR